MPDLLLLKKQKNMIVSSAAHYRWRLMGENNFKLTKGIPDRGMQCELIEFITSQEVMR